MGAPYDFDHAVGYIIPFKEDAPKSENQHLTMAITITENK